MHQPARGSVTPLRSLPALWILVASCTSFPTPPQVDLSASASSAYVFRGLPRDGNPVLFGDASVTLVDEEDRVWSGGAWGVVATSGDNDDGVFPDGNANKVEELDLYLVHTRPWRGWDASLGVLKYEFPNGVGPSTAELFGSLGRDFGGVRMTGTLYRDIEHNDGFAAQVSASKSWPLGETWKGESRVALTWLSARQGQHYFGEGSSGLSEARAAIHFRRPLRGNLSFDGSLAGSWVLDSDFSDALGARGIEDGRVWLSAGVGWSR